MEIWKEVKGYEDYQVSNFGNIKSLKYGKEIIKKKFLNKKNGYYYIGFSKNSKYSNFPVHQLVAMVFLNHKLCGHKLVVNHINFIKTDNRVENLEIVTNRENCNHKHLKSTSIYTGVSWCKIRKKWKTQIYINGKVKNLGRFNTEIEASKKYQEELKNI